jgi:hypothetical protein
LRLPLAFRPLHPQLLSDRPGGTKQTLKASELKEQDNREKLGGKYSAESAECNFFFRIGILDASIAIRKRTHQQHLSGTGQGPSATLCFCFAVPKMAEEGQEKLHQIFPRGPLPSR